MDLYYIPTVEGLKIVEELVNAGYVKMYYPNGKEVDYDTSGDQYTFLSYFNNVKVQEFETSYRVTFGFSTSLSGAESANEYGSFNVLK